MFTAVSTWSAPNAGMEEAFEEHYRSTHVPLAQKVPNTIGLTLIRTAAALPGEPSAFYRAVVTSFPDAATFEAATRTPQWDSLRADTALMIERFGVRLLTGMGAREVII
jgi:uncharacterized protein (TIGR02118 family)